MHFEFATAQRILFGRGALGRLGEVASGLGRRAFVVRGGAHLESSGVLDTLSDTLRKAGITVVFHPARDEPSVADVEDALGRARAEGCDLVAGVGGGAALDLAKAVAGLLHGRGAVGDHLEVVGKGLPVVPPAAPLIAIPTTAGTGSEATRNAVITCPDPPCKASIRSIHLLPRVALVDPELARTVPPAVTASTGLDAVAQLIEPYVSLKAGPMTDLLAREGLRRAVRALPRAFADGGDLDAREDMALAALWSGMCLANAGLGTVHGFAAPLGARFGVPHGTACAALLAPVMAANVSALRARLPESPALARYAELGRILAGRVNLREGEAPAAGVAALETLAADFRIPRLSAFGVTASDVGVLVERARATSSIRNNPVELTAEELAECLRKAM
jgi:alcohol dehydrogenase class IV